MCLEAPLVPIALGIMVGYDANHHLEAISREHPPPKDKQSDLVMPL